MSSVITQFIQQQLTRRAAKRGKPTSQWVTSVMAAGLALCVAGGAANAQTTGLQLPDTGDLILFRLGFRAAYDPSSLQGTDPQFLNFDGVTFNYIRNPYMAVVQGVTGTWAAPFADGQYFGIGNGFSITHNSAGMLSFGNMSGSLRIANDDMRALNGFGEGESYSTGGPLNPLFSLTINGGGVPYGYGVWPLPGWWLVEDLRYYDWSSYVSVNVDGVQGTGAVTDGEFLEVVGGDEEWVIEPTFRANAQRDPVTGAAIAGDNVLLSEAVIPEECVLRQEVRLFRNTAQLTWRVRSTDGAAHNVYLRFAVNHRPVESRKITDSTTLAATTISPSYYYTDPDQGPTLRTQIYGITPDGTLGRTVPSQIDVLGGRYQPDSTVVEPYHGRHLFTGFGATAPATVYVADSEDLLPESGRDFSPGRAGIRYEQIQDGIAVAAYYGPIAVPAGGGYSEPIVTYYGNGSSSDLLQPDFTTATEAEESFQYNANAINTITAEERSNPSLDTTALKFLTPNRLDVYGSVYNRQLSEAQFDVTLNNVRMSLTLPDALRFSTLPSTGQPDTAVKVVGNIPGDTEARAQWLVEPTGRLYGTYSYTMTATIGAISPLSRTVSRSVTIPATPLYNVSANYYQQIGFPFEFDPAATNNSDAATILNTLSAGGSSEFVLYEWTPDPDVLDGSGNYTLAQTIQRGKGYFYRPSVSKLLYLNGARPDTQATPETPGARVQYFQTVLERGWNNISNPFVYAVPVSFISFADINNDNPDANLVLTSFPDAVASNLVRGGIFFYNPGLNGGAGGYDFFQNFQQELLPYQGYWIYVEDRKIFRIAVPSRKQTAVIAPPGETDIPFTRSRKKEPVGAIASSRAFPTSQTSDNWKLQLAVKPTGADVGNGNSDSTTLIGVTPKAKDGDDSRDLPKPPPIVNGSVSMRILHEVGGKTRGFAQDLKAPGGKKTWELEVVAAKDGRVALSWPNLSRLPKSVRLTLVDNQTKRSTVLRGTSSVVVNAVANKPTRYTLIADRAASRPLALTNIRFENKGRGINGTNYSLSFKATADAQVEARVISLSGKTISNFGGGRAAVAGAETRLNWGGRSQDGSAIAPGAYSVEITARGENGDLVTERRFITTLN